MMKYLNNSLLKAFLLLFFIGFLAGCAKPADTLYDFKKAFNEKNMDTVWNLLTDKDKKHIEKSEFAAFKESVKNEPQILKSLQLTEEEFNKMSAKDFFVIAMRSSMGEQQQKTFSFEVENQRILGKKATVKLKNDPNEYLLEKEGLTWKISLKGLTSIR